MLSVVWPASDCAAAASPLPLQIGQRFRPQVVEVRADLNARTNIRIINGSDGAPAFVVIPYADYMAQHEEERDLIPHEVISATIDGATPLRAWREHLKLTQAISRPDSASASPRTRSRSEARNCARRRARRSPPRLASRPRSSISDARSAAKESRQTLRCWRLF